MPDPNTEPEKYTIDEMMDRLKARESSEPELVTRPDGSQAMKVRKRKRRSNQAVNDETKRNQRVQVAQIAGFVIILVLLGLAVGVGILYANSSAFRESLLAKLETGSGAKVSLIRFRMNPSEANANEVNLAWPEGNALASLKLSSVVAKVSPESFLGKSFKGEEIVADKGRLLLRNPNDTLPARNKPPAAGEIPVRFSRYSVPHLEMAFGEKARMPRALKGTEASIFPSTTAGHAEIRFRGGLLEFDAWPPMDLDRSYIKVRDGSFQVQSMRLTVPKSANQRILDKGFIDFSGTLRPLDSGAPHTLESSVSDFRLPYLLGADLGRFFLGRVDSKEIPDSNFLTFDPSSAESATLELTLTNNLDARIDLGGFRFLSQLSVALDDRWYELPNFADDATLVVRRRAGMVVIEKINLVSRGRMALQGSVSNAEGGKISGTLRIGLPETTISAATNKRLNLMFGQVREGYRWLDIEISGTSALPEDNFRKLYENVAETPTPEPTEEPPAPDSFDKLIEGKE